MLRNALYLDELYKTDCENKINYRLVEADTDINLSSGDVSPLITLDPEGSNLLGDQILGSDLSAITIEDGEDNDLKTLLIASFTGKNYFKFIYLKDELGEN